MVNTHTMVELLLGLVAFFMGHGIGWQAHIRHVARQAAVVAERRMDDLP